jgi:hypothetical protein
VIVILAAMRDDDTASLASELPARAAILTLAELAAERSCLHDPGFERSTVTVEDDEIGVGEIAGIVNLLPAVLPDALTIFDPNEREYQASELHAWLLFFLSALRCPVVNRPTPLSLNGPVQGGLGWFALARASGVPVSAVSVGSSEPDTSPEEGDVVEVACVGGVVVSPSGTAADRNTLQLARRANLEYLSARYVRDGGTRLLFAGASSIPDARSAPDRAALADYFRR